MNSRSASLLSDIVLAADEIFEYVKDLSFEQYADSSLVRAAVQWKLAVVGEATVQLKAVDEPLAKSLGEIRGVIAFRNILIHRYKIIDDAAVWKIIKDFLPVYLSAARTALMPRGGP